MLVSGLVAAQRLFDGRTHSTTKFLDEPKDGAVRISDCGEAAILLFDCVSTSAKRADREAKRAPLGNRAKFPDIPSIGALRHFVRAIIRLKIDTMASQEH